jgi:hypothetical protein
MQSWYTSKQEVGTALQALDLSLLQEDGGENGLNAQNVQLLRKAVMEVRYGGS